MKIRLPWVIIFTVPGARRLAMTKPHSAVISRRPYRNARRASTYFNAVPVRFAASRLSYRQMGAPMPVSAMMLPNEVSQ